MKVLLRIVVILLLLALVITGIGLFMIDSGIKQAVERGGTYALGVETKLDSADLGLTSGTLQLDGLTVKNPSGFKDEHFVALDHAGVGLSIKSLGEDVVRVPYFELDGIALAIERQGTKTNVDAILANLAKFESGAPPPSDEEVEPPAEDGMKFIVQKLTIANVTAVVRLLGTSELSKVTLVVPEILLENVGSAEGGLTTAELVSTIVKALLAATLEGGQGNLPADLLRNLEGQLGGLKNVGIKLTGDVVADVQGKIEGVTDDLNKKLEGVTEGLEGVTDKIPGVGDKLDEKLDGAVQDAAKELEKGLGGLLKKKKKDEDKE